MKKYTKRNKRTVQLLILLIGMMFANGYLFSTMGYSIARVFFVGLVGLAMISDLDNLFYITAFCFPLASILKLSTDSMSVLPFLYLIIIIKLVVRRKTRINVYSLIHFAFFVILQMLTILLYGSSVVSIFSFLLSTAFVMCSSSYFLNIRETNTQIKTTSIFFVSGVVIEIILSYLFPRIPYIVNLVKHTVVVNHNRYAALNVDPNEFSQIVLVAIGLLIAILPITKSKLGKLINVIVMIFLAINGYQSYSKSYVITLLLMYVIVILMYFVTTIQKKGAIVACLKFVPIAIVMVVGIVLIYDKVIVPVFEARATFNTDLLTGREYIWKEYLNALRQRIDVLILGCGVSNAIFLDKYASVHGKVTHNLYLEFLIQYGIVGLIFLAGSYKQLIKNIFKSKVTNYMVLPLAAFLITSFGISANANDCLFLVMVLMSMPYLKENQTKIKMF